MKRFLTKKNITNLYYTVNYFRIFIDDIVLSNKDTKCDISGEKKNLVVHHLNIGYSKLLHEAFDNVNIKFQNRIADLTLDQIDLVKDELIKLHKEKAKFVTLTYGEHKRYHEIYKNEITEEAYKEFKISRKYHQKIARKRNRYKAS